VAWEYTGSALADAAFYILEGNLAAHGAGDYRANRYLYKATNGFNSFFSQYDSIENQLNSSKDAEDTPHTYNLTVGGATGITVSGTPQLSGPHANLFTLVGHSKPSADVIQFDVREVSNTPYGTYNITVLFSSGGGSYSVDYSIEISPQTVDINCNGGTYNDLTLNQALAQWESCFNAVAAQAEDFVNFLDRSQGFHPGAAFYVNGDPAYYNTLQGLPKYDIGFVGDVHDHLHYDSSLGWFNYTAPSHLALGPFFAFEVYIKDTIDAVNDHVVSSSYIIKNQSMRLLAGGGYVPEGVPVNPATDTEGVESNGGEVDTSGVTFNNEVFTDQNLVAIANNDVVRTPSTV